MKDLVQSKITMLLIAHLNRIDLKQVNLCQSDNFRKYLIKKFEPMHVYYIFKEILNLHLLYLTLQRFLLDFLWRKP